jgi:hypothetical protein
MVYRPRSVHRVIWFSALCPSQASTTVSPLVSQPSYSVSLAGNPHAVVTPGNMQADTWHLIRLYCLATLLSADLKIWKYTVIYKLLVNLMENEDILETMALNKILFQEDNIN